MHNCFRWTVLPEVRQWIVCRDVALAGCDFLPSILALELNEHILWSLSTKFRPYFINFEVWQAIPNARWLFWVFYESSCSLSLCSNIWCKNQVTQIYEAFGTEVFASSKWRPGSSWTGTAIVHSCCNSCKLFFIVYFIVGNELLPEELWIYGTIFEGSSHQFQKGQPNTSELAS